jgi:hypothetical protein
MVANQPDRKVVLAVTPQFRDIFLSKFPVARVLGNIDYSLQKGWHDLLRVYEISPRHSSPWLNPDLILKRIRSGAIPAGSQSVQLSLTGALTKIPTETKEPSVPHVQRISGRISNSGIPLEADICLGVETPGGRILFFPEWSVDPAFFPITLQGDTGFFPILTMRTDTLPGGDYSFFMQCFQKNTLYPISSGALMQLSIDSSAAESTALEQILREGSQSLFQ